MAKLEDVFVVEADRHDSEKWSKIHLFKMGKLHIQEIHKGVEFLGTFIKPYCDYISNKTLDRIKRKLQHLDLRNMEKVRNTINSYMGILSHTASYHIRQDLLLVA